jgi:hypothetical protein
MLKATAGKIMPTTITGSLPRPSWYTENLSLKSFLDAMVISRFLEQYVDALSVYLREQEVAGLDIVTDGDCRFDQDIGGQSWTSYPPNHMAGFDTAHPKLAAVGAGGIGFPRGHILHDYLEARVMPKITGPIGRGEMQYAEIWKAAQRLTPKPVKFGTVTPELVAFADVARGRIPSPCTARDGGVKNALKPGSEAADPRTARPIAAEPRGRGSDRQPWQSKLLPTMFGRSNRRSWLYASSAAVLAAGLLLAGLSFSRFSASKPQSSPTPSAVFPAPDASSVSSPPLLVPLTLSMNIIGQRKELDGSYSEIIVREGSVLRSRDHFQVHLETNRPSHVYVLLFDSQGRASQLFPDPKIGQPGFIEGGRRIAIPEKDLWFWLDEHPGTETVYVLASEEPMPDIRGLLQQMATAYEAERKQLSGDIKQRIGIVERGVGGVAKGKAVNYELSDGRHIQKVTELVTGAGAAVRAVSFQHK